MNNHLQTENSVDRFIAAISGAMVNLQEAGEIAAKAMAENPHFIDEVCAKCPDMTPGFIRKMEAIGLKKLHPQLAINESPGVKRLIRLPLAIQDRHTKEPVALLIRTETGWDTLRADVRSLSPDQARQVISDDNIRSESEQRLWLENEAAKRAAPPAPVVDCGYKIIGNKVRFTACTMSRADLARLLARMEEH
jgi:hypothetical protein